MTEPIQQPQLHEQIEDGTAHRVAGSWATPGPWHFYDNGDDELHASPGWIQSFWTRGDNAQSPGGDIVCDVFDRDDAKLIALAPEMAEAILATHWARTDAERAYAVTLQTAVAVKLNEIGGAS